MKEREGLDTCYENIKLLNQKRYLNYYYYFKILENLFFLENSIRKILE